MVPRRSCSACSTNMRLSDASQSSLRRPPVLRRRPLHLARLPRPPPDCTDGSLIRAVGEISAAPERPVVAVSGTSDRRSANQQRPRKYRVAPSVWFSRASPEKRRTRRRHVRPVLAENSEETTAPPFDLPRWRYRSELCCPCRHRQPSALRSHLPRIHGSVTGPACRERADALRALRIGLATD